MTLSELEIVGHPQKREEKTQMQTTVRSKQ